jgi:nucleotide-binding universal stress UspA family protein
MTNNRPSIPSGSIVVGVDGSRDADRAVRWAADQARLQQRPLAVVAAAGAPSAQGVGWTGAIAGTDPDRGGRVASQVWHVAEAAEVLALRVAPEIETSAHAVVGDPREVLTDLSADAHLLVVGSRGRGVVRSLLLGSVSSAVVRTASCPVVVCRPGTDGNPDGVIVGADGSAESLPVVEFAFEQASLHRQPLTVVHCFRDAVAAAAGFREATGEVLNEPELEELRLVLSESVAGFREKYPDVEVTLLLRHGLVDEALTRRDSSWDLVVVGRHPMTGLWRTLSGSIANAVVERARTNVAVVPERG